MKKIRFIIIIILFSKVAYSQKDSVYHYVLNERIASVDTIPLFGMEQEFFIKRKYFGASSFSETRLLTGSNNKSTVFKIEKGVWYYKLPNKWELFYNYNTMVGGYITLHNVKYKVQFKKVVTIR